MTDHDLDQLMERLGDRTPVGPPPLAVIREGAQRAARRRLVVAGVAAAAVLAVIGGTVLAGGLGGSGEGPGRGGDVVAPDEGFTPPSGTRLVGIGHLAVAVPEEWGTNETRCGTPMKDTVVLDQGAICLAGIPRRTGIESVEILDGWWGGLGSRSDVETQSVEVAGQPAERTATTCSERPFVETSEQPLCRALLYFPELDVSVLADSSSADARRQVNQLLSWVRWVDDRVAVPGIANINMDVQMEEPEGHAGRQYAATLRELGLAVESVSESRPGMKPGLVLGVEPAPGTMLEPGSVVTITVVGEPEGPAEEISVGLNSIGPGDSMDYRGLEDAEIRSGRGRIVVPVGGELWFHPLAEEDRMDGRLVGEVTGNALELDPRTEGPNVGRTWDAVRPGTARLTISLERDGKRYEIGTVTVVVE